MGQLFEELKRRSVFRVGIAYLVVSWLLIQVADTVFPHIGLSSDAITTVIAILALGLVPALILSWFLEITPEGVTRDQGADHDVSSAYHVGRKFDFIIIGVMAVAITYFMVDKFVWTIDLAPTIANRVSTGKINCCIAVYEYEQRCGK